MAMSEEIDLGPEQNFFPTVRTWAGIATLVVVLCVLVYGGTSLSRLFAGTAPITDATPRPDPSSAVTPPQPGCRHGTGACDWARLRLPRPPCQYGAGACDWSGQRSPRSTCREGGTCDTAATPPPQPGCHYGTGRCDWAGTSSEASRQGGDRL
jgi:hypothetical protein